MTDLRDLTDEELFAQIDGDWGVRDCLDEVARRLSSLRFERDEQSTFWRVAFNRETQWRTDAEAERDAEYNDHQKTKQLLNGWRDRACDAESERDRLAEAIEEIAADKTPGGTRCIVQQKIARAALAAARKEKG